MTLVGRIAAGACALLMAFGTAEAAERTIIILDGSGSMWAQIDGEARISIARETLNEVLDSVPDDLELGFMSYGHREEGQCDDIELMVEPAAGTADAIRDAADGITPLGKTPISDAVRLAAEDLSYLEEKATVILITDGIESCEADPCALATDLESRGIDFTTHVVGFGLTDDEGAQVACLAENTGGTYFQASDGDALADALTQTVTQVAAAPEPEPEPAAPEFNFDPEVILYEGGEPLPDTLSVTWEFFRVASNGEKGEQIDTEYGVDYRDNLEPGDYIISVRLDYAITEQPVTIVAGEVAEPLFNLNGGRLVIRPLASEGAEPDSGAAVFTEFASGDSTTNYGETQLYVPAGTTEATVTIGEGQATEAIEVAAGATVERDIIVGVGRVVLNASYVEDMPVEDPSLTFNVVGAKKDIQGNRKDFGTNYGPGSAFDLPPGDYVAVVTMSEAKVEVPFTIASGELTEVNGILDAGVLAITAPGRDFVEVFGAKADIQGNRQGFGYGYGGALQLTLPAGDYVVVAHLGGGAEGEPIEAPATVAAGERAELMVE